jgi:outer membrane protein assembly factor BamB
MKNTHLLFVLVLAALTFAPAVAADQSAWNRNWPQWRGPLGSGVAPAATPPLTWSETENVKWKASIPGSGNATPIVWNDKVFILTAVPTGKKMEPDSSTAESPPGRQGRPGQSRGVQPSEILQFTVLCLDRANGQTLWKQVAREERPHEGHHRDGSFASPSPVTDGEHLLAFFGSRGLYCYDLNGDLKWDRDFGEMKTRNSFGEGSSPALHGDIVVVVWDHEGEDDFVVAVDKRTGKELWRRDRDEQTNWTTPLIVEVEGTAQAIVAGAKATIAYDLETGKELWRGPELTGNVIPHPVRLQDTVIVMSGFRGAALHALELGSSGDLTGTEAVRWSYTRNTPYVPSPVLSGDFLYFASRNSGIFTCLDAVSGEVHFAAERLEGLGDVYASPVAAGNRIYIHGRKGTCMVLERGSELKVLSTNQLDEDTDASAALVGDEMFIRGRHSLYCISEN